MFKSTVMGVVVLCLGAAAGHSKTLAQEDNTQRDVFAPVSVAGMSPHAIMLGGLHVISENRNDFSSTDLENVVELEGTVFTDGVIDPENAPEFNLVECAPQAFLIGEEPGQIKC